MTEPRIVYDSNGKDIGRFFFGPPKNGSIKFQTRSPVADQPVQITFILDRDAQYLKYTLSGIFLETPCITTATWQEHSRQQRYNPCNVATLIIDRSKMRKRGRNPQQIINALGERTENELRKTLQTIPA